MRSRTAASDILDLLRGLQAWRRPRARRGGSSSRAASAVDGEKVTAIDAVIPQDQLAAGAKIKKGKKVYHKAILQ